MNASADLSLRGPRQLVADFLAALDLRDVVMVHSDWGGGIFLTAYGLDDRIARQIICPSEVFDTFRPACPARWSGLPRGSPVACSLRCIN